MEKALFHTAQFIAMTAEFIAAIIIGISIIWATYNYLKDLLTLKAGLIPRNELRLMLGRGLTLALEFMLAADIMRTAVAPTWNELGQLAVVAILRTALNYFLEREIRHRVAEEKQTTDVNFPPDRQL